MKITKGAVKMTGILIIGLLGGFILGVCFVSLYLG